MNEYKGVCLKDSTINGIQENRIYKSIPVTDSTVAKLNHGFLSNNIVIQILMGTIIFIFGISAAIYLIIWAINGGTAEKYHFLALFCVPVGSWIIFDAFKKGYYVSIINNGKNDRISFEKDAEKDGIMEFINHAELTLNIKFRIEA